MSRTRIVFAVVAVIAAAGVYLNNVESSTSGDASTGPASSPTAATSRSGVDQVPAGSTTRHELLALLEQVHVVAERPNLEGYERDCGSGSACSFGPAWTDDTSAPLSHNGCGTRDDLLKISLDHVQTRPGTHGCVVVAGVLEHDPYTGRRIVFTKQEATKVQVDHRFPLALAYDMGAAAWSQERRNRFANDPANLLVVDGSANASKLDHGPGEWLPVNRGYRCDYVAGYLKVAHTYRLPITRADQNAARALAPSCPRS